LFICGLDKIFSGNIRGMMMEAEMVSKTLGFCPQLTRLVAREDFNEFSRRESFKSYICGLFNDAVSSSDYIASITWEYQIARLLKSAK
jgi:hypothetical protein